jgi:hypothetical protein
MKAATMAADNDTKKEKITMNRESLCKKIIALYPDIGECGIDVDVNFDKENNRWKVKLKQGSQKLNTFLEPGDAELCMADKQCVSLGIEISQLKDNIQKLP